MTANIDFDELKTVWNEGDEYNYLPTDEVIRQIQRRVLLTRLYWVLEIISFAATAGLTSYLAATANSLAQSAALLIVTLVVFGVAIWTTLQRFKVWKLPTLSSSEYTKFQIRQADMNLKFARLCYLGGPIGILLGLFGGLAGKERYADLFSFANMILISAFTVISILIGFTLARKSQQEIVNLKELVGASETECVLDEM